jgi:uncharacterized protein YciI
MHFVALCTDKPNGLEIRMQHRPEHLAWLEANKARILLAGPFLGAEGQMTGSMLVIEATDEIDAKVSPKGSYVSWVRDQNLVIYDLATSKETPITDDGAGLITWATAEFIAQEEMDRDTGYWWSPDERYIALTRVDESPVDVVPRFEITGGGATSDRDSMRDSMRGANSDGSFVGKPDCARGLSGSTTMPSVRGAEAGSLGAVVVRASNAERTASCKLPATRRDSKNRTSALRGCTFTSTWSGGIVTSSA